MKLNRNYSNRFVQIPLNDFWPRQKSNSMEKVQFLLTDDIGTIEFYIPENKIKQNKIKAHPQPKF